MDNDYVLPLDTVADSFVPSPRASMLKLGASWRREAFAGNGGMGSGGGGHGHAIGHPNSLAFPVLLTSTLAERLATAPAPLRQSGPVPAIDRVVVVASGGQLPADDDKRPRRSCSRGPSTGR